jgi:hypothetical protein
MARTPLWFGAQWLILAFTLGLFICVAVFVDLKPVVDENFFFSTSDPGVQQSKKIEQRFPSQPQLILTAGRAILLPRDTSAESNDSRKRFRRSMRLAESKVLRPAQRV